MPSRRRRLFDQDMPRRTLRWWEGVLVGLMLLAAGAIATAVLSKFGA